MPTFFNPENLTEYQLKNFDKYKEQYSFVLEQNLKKTISKMTEKDKIKYMSFFSIKNFSEEEFLKKMSLSNNITANPPGHSKSALFYRLLNELPVYIIPPPCSYSYPDYSFLENSNEKEKEIHFYETDEIVKKSNKFIPFKHIMINQSAWKFIKRKSENKFLLTYGDWEKEGFLWELRLEKKSAKETTSFTVSHFNKNISRITKYSEMLEEVKYQVANINYILEIAKDENKYIEYEEEMTSKYSNFGKNLALDAKNRGIELIKTRLEKNLPNYITEDELKKQIDDTLASYMKDYTVVGDDLFANVWIMDRVDEKNINDYILKIENI